MRATQRTHDGRRPAHIGIEQWHARQCQHHQAQREGQVGDAPDRREALHMLALELRGHRVRLDVRLASALFALLVFAIEPECGVQPEEAKGADQQLHHDLPGYPDLRVFVEIMRVAVRLIAGKRCWHIRQTLLDVVAGLAGLHPVVRMDQRFRIVDLADFVAAMAVVALGSVGIAQRTDLTVEGVLVRIELVHMAVAAIGRNGQLESVARSVGDGVRGMAVRADGRLRQQFLAVFLAVHGSQIGFELLGMAACAADRRNLQTPLRALRTVLGRHAEAVRVVAAVASRIGLGLVV